MTQIFIGIGVVVGVGVILSILIALVNQYFKVEVDPRKEYLESNFPGVNCGACGFPGCGGLVDAIIEGKATTCSQCKVMKKEKASELDQYLKNYQK